MSYLNVGQLISEAELMETGEAAVTGTTKGQNGLYFPISKRTSGNGMTVTPQLWVNSMEQLSFAAQQNVIDTFTVENSKSIGRHDCP